MTRRNFIKKSAVISLAGCFIKPDIRLFSPASSPSPLGKLVPVGRILEVEEYFVWCCSPITAPDGTTHVFFSRWKAHYGMGGWTHASEIAHATSDKPEGPYRVIGTVLPPRPGYWDASTCHNPSIHKVGAQYCLFYMGARSSSLDTQRIGIATSSSLYGPWKRSEQPVLDAGNPGQWDDECTTNPAFVEAPNGTFLLYYISFNKHAYETQTGSIRGNRKCGLAIAENPCGPYKKYPGNPVVDFSVMAGNQQLEDPFVWRVDNLYKMISRDMGVFGQQDGLYMESGDGFNWSRPVKAYESLSSYMAMLAPVDQRLKKFGRMERPALLLERGKPTYLFGATQGGRYNSSSGIIFKIT